MYENRLENPSLEHCKFIVSRMISQMDLGSNKQIIYFIPNKASKVNHNKALKKVKINTFQWEHKQSTSYYTWRARKKNCETKRRNLTKNISSEKVL